MSDLAVVKRLNGNFYVFRKVQVPEFDSLGSLIKKGLKGMIATVFTVKIESKDLAGAVKPFRVTCDDY